LLDPTGGEAIDVTSGCATREFLDWLQAKLSSLDEFLSGAGPRKKFAKRATNLR
jgi:hypothetical protein